MTLTTYRFEAEVGADGRLEIVVPMPPGSRVEVLVLGPEHREFDELLAAAGSSTDFWDNPLDDAEWNNA